MERLEKTDKAGHIGFFSGEIIILNEATKATVEIMYGNNFGPTGSEKKGVSNCVALAKNASAIKAINIPSIRSFIKLNY